MKKIFIIVVIMAVLAAAAFFYFKRNGSGGDTQYELVEITRGNLENIVSSSGTLSAVGTVEIGTQVSGTIDRVLVDFNDTVKKGQILAILDTTNLKVTVLDAEANVMKCEAELEKAKSEYDRNLELFDRKLISEQDYLTAKTALKSAEASLQNAQNALVRAKTNLGYAVIRSPIDGSVIYRDVEEGQTVAASLSTPTLFIIAKDLANMEIHALVDESDIGQIKEGQKIRFTVQAYLDETFTGVVRQVRLQPETVSNVVNYTVVIDAANRDNMLLPGMTATVDFIVESRDDVLLIPNKALRFQPTTAMLESFRKDLPDSLKERLDRMKKMRESGMSGGMAAGMPPEGASGLPGMMSSDNNSKKFSRLWAMDDNGKVLMIPVVTGITDGKSTELVSSRETVNEGLKLIAGTAAEDSSTPNSGSAQSQPQGPMIPRF
ncbi:MAG: efflux RND transporter periplasmic adaptor subunit [Candidatus Zixiibacteriota bacterium]